MSKTSIVILILWIVLAILNIVSLFKICFFLIICNHIFGFLNALMVLALIPEIWRYLFKKERGV